MEKIKQGYKQTDIGVIPEDWEVGKLEEVITVLTDFTANGSFASLADNVTYLDTPSYARLVRLTDIRANFKNPGVYLSKESYCFLKKSKLFGEELLLANVGAYAGYSFLYPSGLNFIGSLGPNMFLIKFDQSKLDSKYAFYCFTNGIIFQQLLSKAASSAQPKLNKQNVRECDIIFPTKLSEQTAIATALSDTDAFIAALDKKIAKKQQIKQGAMQQLLTGKKRLPGFSGENKYKETEIGLIPEDWEIKCLGEISTNASYGVGAAAVDFDGKSKYIRITDIDDKTRRFCPSPLSSPSYSDDMYKVTEGDVLFARTGASVGKSYLYNPLDGELIFAGFLIRFTISDASPEYVFYYTLTKRYNEWVLSESARTGQPGINLVQYKSFKIPMPQSKSEQTAIAQILTDMDNEIAQLEKERDKYKELKAGMMQVLLTGKVRLV